MKIILCVMLVLSSVSAFAEREGGGGRGIVCKNTDDSIASVELLDFFEGRNLERYLMPEKVGNYNDIIQQEFVQKIEFRGYLEYLSTKWLPKIKDGLRLLPPGIRLEKVEDSGEIFNLPLNCSIEQLANFQGISRIFVVGDYWDKMSETSKAGLVLHELLWFIERSAGSKKSSRVRRTVARYFASNYTFAKFDFLGPKIGSFDLMPGDFLCKSLVGKRKMGSVLFIRKRNNEHILTFSRLNGAILHQPHVANLNSSHKELLVALVDPYKSYTASFFTRATYSSASSYHVELAINTASDLEKVEVKIKALNFEFPGYDDEIFEDMECEKLNFQTISELLIGTSW